MVLLNCGVLYTSDFLYCTGYKLLIVCSDEDDDNSVQIKNQLREFQKPFSINMSDDDLAKLIKEHLVVKRTQLQGTMNLACSVDPER